VWVEAEFSIDFLSTSTHAPGLFFTASTLYCYAIAYNGFLQRSEKFILRRVLNFNSRVKMLEELFVVLRMVNYVKQSS
jgi:hypothetical protein